ncbi:hypothetical protein S7335_2252 [Synechococcus sp. PCC 7335]|nr:hypothetical protein S7335_2252 [Synechococcus sp. PCC 7335]
MSFYNLVAGILSLSNALPTTCGWSKYRLDYSLVHLASVL